MKVCVSLLAALAALVVVSSSSVNVTDTGNSLTTGRTSSLLKELLLKQDMTQALLLTNSVIQFMVDVQTLKEEVRSLNKQNLDLRNQLSLFNKSFEENIERFNNPVAFHVYFAADFKSLAQGSVFIFDTVETNLGGGYNKTTGVFTAPTSGLYAFSWTVHAAERYAVLPKLNSEYGETNAALMQNGAIKGAIVADTEREYDTGSSTGYVVLTTKAGDKFQIAVTGYDGQGDIFSNDIHGRTTFSGYRIA